MKTIVAGASDQLEKAKRIYAYVRDNFTCINHNEIYDNWHRHSWRYWRDDKDDD